MSFQLPAFSYQLRTGIWQQAGSRELETRNWKLAGSWKLETGT
jgi:hypothetical protein